MSTLDLFGTETGPAPSANGLAQLDLFGGETVIPDGWAQLSAVEWRHRSGALVAALPLFGSFDWTSADGWSRGVADDLAAAKASAIGSGR